MTLTVRMLEGITRYEVGATPGTPIEFTELVNIAGRFFVQSHAWRFLEGRQLVLRSRARIELTGATWTEASRTLTKTGAFAGYSFLTGDTLVVTGGTGATVGTYEVESKTNSNSVVLLTSLGAGADGQTDIAGRMPNDQVSLAPDFTFQSLTAIQTVDGTVSSFHWVRAQGLLDLRSWPGYRSTTSFFGLLNYVRGRAGGAPQLRLDHWPELSTADEWLLLFYRAGWKAPESDTEELSLPAWAEPVFIEMVKAVVNGYEDPEGGTVDQRLTAVRLGVLFRMAITEDSMVQPDLGPMEAGWTDFQSGRVGRYDVETPTPLPPS